MRRLVLGLVLLVLVGAGTGAALFLMQPKPTKYHPQFGTDCAALLTPETVNAVDCVRVLFGTNRELVLEGNEPGLDQEADTKDVLPNDAGRLHLGRADVWLPKLIEEGGSRDRGDTPILNGPPPPETSELAKYVFLTRITKAGTDAFLAELDQAVADRRSASVLLFVHGFNTPFDDALIRSAQLSVDLSRRGVFDAGAPVLFSWPSAGKVSLGDYRGDQARSLEAAPYLEEFLDLITENAQISRINIVAHSMGNRILTKALESYAADYLERHDRDDLEFRIILVAADVDRDIFEATTGILDNLQANVTIYTSDVDRALHVSEIINNKLRLGDTNGDKPYIRQNEFYETVDATGIATELFGLGHNYYSDNPFILGDIHCAMAEANPELRALERRRYGSVPDGSEYFRLNAAIDRPGEECSLFRDAFPLTDVSQAPEPAIEPARAPPPRLGRSAPRLPEPEAGDEPAQGSAAEAEAEAARRRDLEEAERRAEPLPPPPAMAPSAPPAGALERAPVFYSIPVTNRNAVSYQGFEDVLQSAMNEGEIARVIIRAHTDSVGDKADNLELSQRWADDLRAWMANRGVPLDVISAEGFGEDLPLEIVADGTPSRLNQRIDVEILYTR